MRGRLTAVLAALTALVVLVGARAVAAVPSPSVPDQVADVFARDVLPWVVAEKGGKDADEIGKITGVDTIHEVFGFTPDYLRGDSEADPIGRLNRWCGVLRAAREGVGIVHVEQGNGAIRPVRFTMSPELAAGLDGAGTGYYIEGPPQLGTWTLAGQTLTPADEWARRISSQPLTLAAAQPLLHERWASAEGGGPSRTQIGLLVLGALLLILLGLVLIARANAAARRGRGSPPAPRLAG